MKLHRVLPRTLLAGGIIGVILWVFLNRDYFDPSTLDAWLVSFGILAPLIYLLLYTIGTVAFVPGSLLASAGVRLWFKHSTFHLCNTTTCCNRLVSGVKIGIVLGLWED